MDNGPQICRGNLVGSVLDSACALCGHVNIAHRRDTGECSVCAMLVEMRANNALE